MPGRRAAPRTGGGKDRDEGATPRTGSVWREGAGGTCVQYNTPHLTFSQTQPRQDHCRVVGPVRLDPILNHSTPGLMLGLCGYHIWPQYPILLQPSSLFAGRQRFAWTQRPPGGSWGTRKAGQYGDI